MRKIKIAGYSKESMDGALADAMSKAAVYLSEERDVNIQVLELTMLPGRGYRALIEVTIVPMGEKDRFKVKPADVEIKDIKEHESRSSRKKEEDHMQHLVPEHFAAVRDHLPDIPDYFQININEARLLNYDIERAFFKASHDIYPCKSHELPEADQNTPALNKVLGKTPDGGKDLEPK